MKYNNVTGQYEFENDLEREVARLKNLNYVSPQDVQENIIKLTGGSKKQKEAMNTLREASRNIVDILDGDSLIRKELKEVIFSYEPTELLSRTQIFNDMHLEVPVIGLNTNNELEIVNTFDFNTETSKKAIVDNIPEGVIKCGRIDIVNRMINSEANKKIEINVCNTLNNTVLKQSRNLPLRESISEALNKIGKVHQHNISIALNPVNYALYSDELKNFDKFDIVLSPYLNDVYVGNLNAVVVNFVADKCELDKDIETGLYVAVQNLWALNSVITDNTAICKICDTINS